MGDLPKYVFDFKILNELFYYFADPSLLLTKLQEVAVGNFITHPSTVIAITMTSIRTDAGKMSCYKI